MTFAVALALEVSGVLAQEPAVGAAVGGAVDIGVDHPVVGVTGYVSGFDEVPFRRIVFGATGMV